MVRVGIRLGAKFRADGGLGQGSWLGVSSVVLVFGRGFDLELGYRVG